MTDWPGIEEPAQPATEGSAWPGTEEPRQNFFNMPESDRQVSRLVPNINHIMKGLNAFGEAFVEDLQPESIGLSGPSHKFLEDYKIFPKDSIDYSNPMFPFAAFDECIIRPFAV